MDETKYEKIDAIEAIALLAKGEIAYTEGGTRFRLDGNSELEGQSVEQYSFVPVELSLGWVLKQNWYKPKPFDVRQAMLDRPNEWVGAYKNFEGKWFKVGFDVKRMRPVRTFMNCEAKVNLHDGRVFVIELGDLDICIPIEDVPEHDR